MSFAANFAGGYREAQTGAGQVSEVFARSVDASAQEAKK